MDAPGCPAPYRSQRGYLPLAAYREAQLGDGAFLGQQFGVELVRTGPPDDMADRRLAAIASEIDRLPVQVKDLIRAAIEEIQVTSDRGLPPATLAAWSNGVLRINGASPTFERRPRGPAALNASGSLLRTTLIHECGHILAEDPRGGVPLRDYLTLLAASGWLPDPLRDPLPYGAVGEDVRQLADHYGRRLREARPGWDLGRPLRDPRLPGVRHFDRDVMANPGGDASPATRRGLGLLAQGRLAVTIAASHRRDEYERALSAVGLTLPAVQRTLNRRGPITRYAGEEVAETPAELFAVLHRGRLTIHQEPEALREGQRVLCEPWLLAERSGPPRQLAPRIGARRTRGVGVVAGPSECLQPSRGRGR